MPDWKCSPQMGEAFRFLGFRKQGNYEFINKIALELLVYLPLATSVRGIFSLSETETRNFPARSREVRPCMCVLCVCVCVCVCV